MATKSTTSKQVDLVSIDTVRHDINAILADYFEQKIAFSSELDDSYAELWRVTASVTQLGGKRFRPYLLLMTYQGLGGEHYNQVLPIAAAQELLHVSLLIHDDIADNDYIRHGQPNVAGTMRQKYRSLTTEQDATKYANNAALLAGDLLIAGAHQLIAESGVSPKQKTQAMLVMGKGIDIVAGGQLLDMEHGLKSFNVKDSLKVANYKTSSYSFMVPLVIGAQLAGAGETTIKQCEELAFNLGIGFQLVDDLLGLYGDEEVTGKPILSDIREGKHTYLMAQTFALASSQQLKYLDKTLGDPNVTVKDLEVIRQIVDDCGAKQATIAKVQECAKEARVIIERLPLQTQAKQALEQFLVSAMERDH